MMSIILSMGPIIYYVPLYVHADYLNIIFTNKVIKLHALSPTMPAHNTNGIRQLHNCVIIPLIIVRLLFD